jgi:hypothetical protein
MAEITNLNVGDIFASDDTHIVIIGTIFSDHDHVGFTTIFLRTSEPEQEWAMSDGDVNNPQSADDTITWLNKWGYKYTGNLSAKAICAIVDGKDDH